MQQTLTIDLLDLDRNIKGNALRIRANEMVLSALKKRTPMNDYLKFFYAGVFGNYQLNEITAACTTLQSVGLDLISYDSLRNAILHLYAVRY